MKLRVLITNFLTVLLLAFGMMIPAAAQAKVLNTIDYRTHVTNSGWQEYVTSPNESGTVGQATPIEALEIKKDPNSNVDFTIEAHVQDRGWLPSVTNAVAGTTGEGKRLEAVKISVAGEKADNYDVKYQAHVSNVGWMNWVQNGEQAGTTGKSRGIEAIRIRIIPKTDKVDTDDSSGFVALNEYAPDILQDVRYFSTYNFVGDRIDGYQEPTVLITKEAAKALKGS